MKHAWGILVALVLAASSAQAKVGGVYERFLPVFAELSWKEKIDAMNSIGAEYTRDCTNVMAGRGTTCFQTLWLRFPAEKFVMMREAFDGSVHQWCAGVGSRMICLDENTGKKVKFGRFDDTWKPLED
jgi:hypothetical protein